VSTFDVTGLLSSCFIYLSYESNYENDFKIMIVELLKSGQEIKDISIEYDLNDGMIK
jgi:transposase-like protein